MKASLLATHPRGRRSPGFIAACIAMSALGLFVLANNAAAVSPTKKTAVDRDETRVDDSYWRGRGRGGVWYDDPLPPRKEGPKPKYKAIPPISRPTPPQKAERRRRFGGLPKRIRGLAQTP